MNALITQNIKITVESMYKSEYSKPDKQYYIFAYKITIENKGEHTIQLMTRHWEIFDSVGERKKVDGRGVIGQQPILKPGEKYPYVSGCNLKSDLGCMEGHYNMLNHVTQEMLTIPIPKFNLIANYRLN